MSGQSCLGPTVLAGAILLLACGVEGDAEPDTKPDTTAASTITILYPGDEYALSPAQDDEPKFLVFLPMVKQEPDGEPVGRLARAWEPSDDHRAWTYHLRTDVRWHDGTPVTARDVAFSIDLLSDPEDGTRAYGAIESVTVLDDSTITIQHARPVEVDWWSVFYPKHLLEHLDPARITEWDYWTRPVGNGPYRYVRHVPKTLIELEANPDYYAGPPAIGRVVLKFGDTSLTELIAGNVDVVPYVEPLALMSLEGDSRFRAYYQINTLLGRAIFWYAKSPLFGDARVRRAFTMAIDRRELLRTINWPDFVPITDAPFTERQFRRGNLVEPLPFDPARAEELLAEAGWIRSGAREVRSRNGAELRFKVIVPGAGDWLRMGTYIQRALRRVGAEMELVTLDPGAAAARVQRGDIEASIFRFTRTASFMRLYFTESGILGYGNPEVEALVEEIFSTVSADEEDRLYTELAWILREEAPLTFLMPRLTAVAASSRVRGLSSPFRSFACRHIEDLWIEE